MTSTLESHAPARPGAVREVKTAIIGSGFAGLGMAIALERRGETDFVLLERADDVGGTWRDNTYPGAACDVPSQLYSYSFAPNPSWSRSFSPQPEIQAYIQEVAERSGTLDRFRFRTNVDDLTWDQLSRLRIKRALPMGIDEHGKQVIARYDREERIPLLAEVLHEVAAKLVINVELKLDLARLWDEVDVLVVPSVPTTYTIAEVQASIEKRVNKALQKARR